MIRKFIVILLLFLIVQPVFSQAARPIYGYAPAGSGGSGGVAIDEITGSTEVIATYGEDVAAGDAIVARLISAYDVGTGDMSSVTLQQIATSITYYGRPAFHPSGRAAVIGNNSNSSGLAIYRVYFDESGSFLSYNNYKIATGLTAGTNLPVAISPQGDKLFCARSDQVYLVDIDYSNGVLNCAISATPTVDIQPSGTKFNAKFNPAGDVVAVGMSTTPYVVFYRRLATDEFIKLPNPDLPASVNITDFAWTPSGKQLITSKGDVFTIDYDTWTITKADNVPVTGGSAGYLGLNESGDLLAISLTSVLTPPLLYRVDYINSIASFTLLDPLPESTSGYSSDCVFFGGGKKMLAIKQNAPYYNLYDISYPAGVASFSINSNFTYSFGGSKPIYMATDPSNKHLLSIQTTYGFRYFFATYDYSYSLIGEYTAIFKPSALSDYWSSQYFGYAKESGTAGQQKTVVKFPESY